MFKFSPLRVLALASVLAAAFVVPASAATKVNVRVEGSEATLFDGSVSVSAASLLSNTGEDRGSHQCNVAANGGGGAPAATPTSALVAASQTALGDRLSPIALQWYGDFSDFLVGSIGGQAPAGFDYWELSVNWKVAQVGGCGVALKKGDSVLWAVSDGAKPSLRLSAPNTAKRGRS
ncbi:MAG: hypothetical protein F2813_08115, partial [Actinobacteria bacterium]|nr:hypothetical protein [Actinomycetota bacterium]